MDFDQTFPLKYLLNLSRRPDRRARCEEVFETFDLQVERFSAVDSRWVRKRHGFQDAGRYAHAVSCRMILRKAMLAEAPAVFIFEDDVVLDQRWIERLRDIDLPDDWGIFYLSCQHQERPSFHSQGLLRVAGALDTHAWGVRAQCYRLVMRTLAGKEYFPKKRPYPPADFFLAQLHADLPSYAVFPNLAWQLKCESSLLNGAVFSNYNDDGVQRPAAEVTAGLVAESMGKTACPAAMQKASRAIPLYRPWFPGKASDSCPSDEANEGSPVARKLTPKIAFLCPDGLFLPRMWSEFAEGADDAHNVFGCKDSRVTSGRALFREPGATEGWMTETRPGTLLEMLRLALADEGNSHFVIVGPNCVPLKPVETLLRVLAWDPRSRLLCAPISDDRWSSLCMADQPSPGFLPPKSTWRQHGDTALLDREAAECIVTEDFTDFFRTKQDFRASYVGTVLNWKGFPIDGQVVQQDISVGWPDWKPAPDRSSPEAGSVKPEDAAALAVSPWFFMTHLGEDTNIGDFGLHRPPMRSTSNEETNP